MAGRPCLFVAGSVAVLPSPSTRALHISLLLTCGIDVLARTADKNRPRLEPNPEIQDRTAHASTNTIFGIPPSWASEPGREMLMFRRPLGS